MVILGFSYTRGRRLRAGTNVAFEIRLPGAQDSEAVQAVAAALTALAREPPEGTSAPSAGARTMADLLGRIRADVDASQLMQDQLRVADPNVDLRSITASMAPPDIVEELLNPTVQPTVSRTQPTLSPTQPTLSLAAVVDSHGPLIFTLFAAFFCVSGLTLLVVVPTPAIH